MPCDCLVLDPRKISSRMWESALPGLDQHICAAHLVPEVLPLVVLFTCAGTCFPAQR